MLVFQIFIFFFFEIRTRNCTHDLITEAVWLFIFIFFKSPHLPSLCILGCPLLPRITTFPSSIINSGQLFLWTWLIAAAWNKICWAEEVSPFSMVTWPECLARLLHVLTECTCRLNQYFWDKSSVRPPPLSHHPLSQGRMCSQLPSAWSFPLMPANTSDLKALYLLAGLALDALVHSGR